MWDYKRVELIDLYNKNYIYKGDNNLYGIPYHQSTAEAGKWLGIDCRPWPIQIHESFVNDLWERITDMSVFDEIREKQSGYGASEPQSLMARRMTLSEEIAQQVKSLEETLARKKRLLEILKENPVIEEFMNLSRG